MWMDVLRAKGLLSNGVCVCQRDHWCLHKDGCEVASRARLWAGGAKLEEIQGFSLPERVTILGSHEEIDWDRLRRHISAGLTSVKQEEGIRERTIHACKENPVPSPVIRHRSCTSLCNKDPYLLRDTCCATPAVPHLLRHTCCATPAAQHLLRHSSSSRQP